jgi:host factor-I protein
MVQRRNLRRFQALNRQNHSDSGLKGSIRLGNAGSGSQQEKLKNKTVGRIVNRLESSPEERTGARASLRRTRTDVFLQTRRAREQKEIGTMESKPAQNIQDTFLNTVRKDKSPITIYLVSGVKLTGKIRSFDKYSVLLENNAQEQLIFKHAISTVVSGRAGAHSEARSEARSQTAPASSPATPPVTEAAVVAGD